MINAGETGISVDSGKKKVPARRSFADGEVVWASTGPTSGEAVRITGFDPEWIVESNSSPVEVWRGLYTVVSLDSGVSKRYLQEELSADLTDSLLEYFRNKSR